MMNFLNTTSIPVYAPNDTDYRDMRGTALAQCVVYILMALVGTSGNILVLVVVSLSRNLQNVTSIFVVMLAASDLLVCVIILPISTISLFNERSWPMAVALCYVTGIVYVVFRWTSIWAIMLISIERCIAIREPLRYTKLVTTKRASIAVILALLFVFLLSLLPIMGLGQYKYSRGKALCAPDYKESPVYTIVLLVGASIFPIIVTLGMYIGVAAVALRTARKGTIVCDENNCTYVPSKKAEFKAVKTLCILTGAFMFCWLPYIGANLWLLGRGHDLGQLTEALTECLALLSSVINPWMYSQLNKSFKLAYKKLKRRIKIRFVGESSREASQTARTSSGAGILDSGGKVASDLSLKVVNELPAPNAVANQEAQTGGLAGSATTESELSKCG